nr:GGDEF domain-containing protein [Antrihabitans stalactiti]
MLALVRRWWRADFDYAWLPAFLDRRGLSRPMRAVVGAWCIIFGICAVLVQFSENGPPSTVAQVVIGVLAASAFYAGARWPTAPWPPEHRSLWFVCWTDIGMAVAIYFGTADRLAALPGCGLFVVIGMYVAVMHSPRTLTIHLAFALSVCATLTVSIAVGAHTDIPILIGRALILMGLIVLIPISLHAGVAFLKEDARESLRDPLTDLLNRRGLEFEAQRLLGVPTTETIATVVMIVDLDRFKGLNDNHGHAGGDAALRAVATRLARAVPAHGLIGRLGGDEFAALFLCRTNEFEARTDAIHNAVHCPGDAVPTTASSGAWILVREDPPVECALDDVLAPADSAMYEAKRAGGNRLVRRSSPRAGA